jgi:rubrerythrin
MKTRKDILIEAIESEVETQNLYAMLAKAFNKAPSKQTFINLIPLENMHEQKIRQQFGKEFPDEKLTISPDKLPKLAIEERLEEPDQALKFAIAQEERAYYRYKHLAENSDDEDTKKLLLNLAEEESNHKDLLQDELNQLHGTMIWFDSSELNGLFED